MKLFLYGTLLDPARLTRIAGRPIPMTPARLPGWRRVRLAGTPFPTLRRGSGTVHGALVDLDGQALRRLRAYEGRRYRLVPLTVRGWNGAVAAHAWVAGGATRKPWEPRA